VPLLKLFGIVAGGWQLLRSALISQQRLAAPQGNGADAGFGGDAGFYEAKILTARFYADHVLSQASGLSHSIVHGGAGALAEGVL
jgi:3-(methylthio)propanoyl-CoA dehydrogenase